MALTAEISTPDSDMGVLYVQIYFSNDNNSAIHLDYYSLSSMFSHLPISLLFPELLRIFTRFLGSSASGYSILTKIT
jgi:hypothetical protein